MIVLDSSFLIAYHNDRDAHHAAASRIMVQFVGGKWGRALLLEYVFLETVTVIKARMNAKAATSVGTTLLEASEIDFVPCSDIFADAFDTFRRDRTHNLSFVDAAIVAVAKLQSPGLVATFDKDFGGLNGITVVAG